MSAKSRQTESMGPDDEGKAEKRAQAAEKRAQAAAKRKLRLEQMTPEEKAADQKAKAANKDVF